MQNKFIYFFFWRVISIMVLVNIFNRFEMTKCITISEIFDVTLVLCLLDIGIYLCMDLLQKILALLISGFWFITFNNALVLLVLRTFTTKISTKKCVPLTISDYLHLLRLSKVWRMLHHRSARWVSNKGC